MESWLMTPQRFQDIAHTIPTNPGIYKYFDAQDQLLYVGKAKHLRKRVSSYFIKNHPSFKTHELVQRIERIEFTIVDTEQDAFLLENALIKEYQPKYNINLKDDKTYPYVVIKNEAFPRVFLTRQKWPDGSEYIGPFTSVGQVREVLDFVKEQIPLRTCKLALTDTNIRKGKFKVCLEYHLGNCKGPCEGLQSMADYRASLEQVRNIIKGNLQPVILHLKQEMQHYAESMAFEKAAWVKQKLTRLVDYQSKSVIVSKYLGSLDVFSLVKNGDLAYVNYLRVENGTIIQTHTVPFETHLDENEEEVLAVAVVQLRERYGSTATEMVLPFPIDIPESMGVQTIPKGGEKIKLLALSQKNVDYFRAELRKRHMLQLAGKSDEEKKQVLYQLQEDLQLPDLPIHIECFDNSNFQGAYPVSAMVCFKDGIPSKKDYRQFHVKTVTGINDFASMKEAVYRRYKRLQDENQALPQLVIIDGGKGQLSAAMEAIETLGLQGRMTLVGLAKQAEELFFPEDQESIRLAFHGEPLKFIRSIRDEVHRFGISFHRKTRSKGTFKNELEQIPGIGKQTAAWLLQTYRSVQKIKKLDEETLSETIGAARAKLVYAYFNAKK
jgi:excinuclease ABC subunit C